MVWYSLKEQWFGILNNVLVLFNPVDCYSLNSGLVFLEQWFGIPDNVLVLFIAIL